MGNTLFRNRIGVVADGADRTAAEPRCFGRQDERLQGQRRIDHGVEEPFELAVVGLVAAQPAAPLEPTRITTKDQENRRTADPRHVRDECGTTIASGTLVNRDHRGLLEIGFRAG